MPFYAWLGLCVFAGLSVGWCLPAVLGRLEFGRRPRRGGYMGRSLPASTSESPRTGGARQTFTECRQGGPLWVVRGGPGTLHARSSSGGPGSSTSGTERGLGTPMTDAER